MTVRTWPNESASKPSASTRALVMGGNAVNRVVACSSRINRSPGGRVEGGHRTVGTETPQRGEQRLAAPDVEHGQTVRTEHHLLEYPIDQQCLRPGAPWLRG